MYNSFLYLPLVFRKIYSFLFFMWNRFFFNYTALKKSKMYNLIFAILSCCRFYVSSTGRVQLTPSLTTGLIQLDRPPIPTHGSTPWFTKNTRIESELKTSLSVLLPGRMAVNLKSCPAPDNVRNLLPTTDNNNSDY